MKHGHRRSSRQAVVTGFVIACAFAIVAAQSSRPAMPSGVSLAGHIVRSSSEPVPNLEALARYSSHIVVGRAQTRRTAWIEGGRKLVTLVDVSVSDILKGEASARVTVLLPGGTDINRPIPIAVTYPDAPSIGPSEEMVLFLRQSAQLANAFDIASQAGGKLTVTPSSGGDAGSVRLGRSRLPLAALTAQIRTHIQ